MIDLNLNPSKKDLRIFSLAMLAFLAFVGWIVWHKSGSVRRGGGSRRGWALRSPFWVWRSRERCGRSLSC